MDWTYLYPLSWWVPQVKCVGVYIFVFQELEGKFRASDDCLQACHSAVQVVRTPKYLSTLLVPTSLADLTNTRVLSWSSQNTNTIMTCLRWGLQNKVESFIQGTEKRIFTNFHREARPILLICAGCVPSLSNEFGSLCSSFRCSVGWTSGMG